MTAPQIAMCMPHRRDDLPAYARTGQLHSGHPHAETASRCIDLLYAGHGSNHDEHEDLNNNPQPDEAARLCRRSVFILDNLGYAGGRNVYSAWFFNERKKVIAVFQDEANRLDQEFNS